MFAPEDCLMISGLQHFRFCCRQWALIHLEQQWAENLRTVEGGGALAVPVVCYGNRNFDDSLVELRDLLEADEFTRACTGKKSKKRKEKSLTF